VASEILNTGWRERLGHDEVPVVDEHEAGRALASLASGATLTAFGHYSTDGAGHEREMAPALAALERVDRFLGGILDSVAPDTLLIVASDHGNIEDVTAGHTRNPVLGLAVGPGAERLGAARSIMDIPEVILGALGADGAGTP
jgi:phosphopentomutase